MDQALAAVALHQAKIRNLILLLIVPQALIQSGVIEQICSETKKRQRLKLEQRKRARHDNDGENRWDLSQLSSKKTTLKRKSTQASRDTDGHRQSMNVAHSKARSIGRKSATSFSRTGSDRANVDHSNADDSIGSTLILSGDEEGTSSKAATENTVKIVFDDSQLRMLGFDVNSLKEAVGGANYATTHHVAVLENELKELKGTTTELASELRDSKQEHSKQERTKQLDTHTKQLDMHTKQLDMIIDPLRRQNTK